MGDAGRAGHAIATLCASPDRRAALGDAARFARTRFSMTVTAARTASVYDWYWAAGAERSRAVGALRAAVFLPLAARQQVFDALIEVWCAAHEPLASAARMRARSPWARDSGAHVHTLAGVRRTTRMCSPFGQ